MHIDDLQRNWERLAAGDALHSILYRPDKHDDKWRPEDFFHSGVVEIDEVLASLEAIGATPSFGRALDFGCGAGRLTQALKKRFDEAVGVDISAGMLELARSHNRQGCQFHHNTEPNLRAFPDAHFDLIYSNITLQHNEPRYIAAYVAEFVRVLRPGGVAVFQVPSRNIDTLKHRIRLQAPYPLKKIYRKFRARLLNDRSDEAIEMPMYSIWRPRMEALIRRCGGTLLQVLPDGGAGPTWESYRYYVTKSSRK